MGLGQDIAQANEYIARASKTIEKQRRVLARTRNPQTIARAQDLVDLLTALRANVERQSETLMGKSRTVPPVRS